MRYYRVSQQTLIMENIMCNIANLPMSDVERDFFPGWVFDDNKKCILIQIQDVGTDFIETDFEFHRIYRFSFNDVNKDEDHFISESQIETISDRLLDCIDNGYNVIVHCHAGLCRSGAVVEAAKLLGMDVDENYPRIPNSDIFNALRKELLFFYSWENNNG